MAYHVGLRLQERLAGLMVLSAYLLLEDHFDDEVQEANRSVPILQCHGLLDPLVPFAAGMRTREFLTGRDYDVEWREYPIPHAVSPQEIRDIGTWLAKRLR